MEVTHGFQVINIRRSLGNNAIRLRFDSCSFVGRDDRRGYTNMYMLSDTTRRRCQGLRRMSLYRDLLGYLRICYKAASTSSDNRWILDSRSSVPSRYASLLSLIFFSFFLFLFSFFFYQREEKKSCPLVYRGSLMSFTSIRFTVTLTIVKICRLKMILPFIACRFPNDDSQSSCDMS